MLKIAYLNAWGLNCAERMLDYLADLAASGVRAFCLTETFEHDNAMLQDHVWTSERRAFPAAHAAIARALGPDFLAAFATNTSQTLRCDRTGRVFNQVRQGNSLFIHRSLAPESMGAREIFPTGFTPQRPRPIARRVLQYASFMVDGYRWLLLNFHGIWIAGEGKGGCPEHLWQSQVLGTAIADLARSTSADRLLLGADLNLDIDAPELATLEAWSMPGATSRLRNLVREAGLTSTRTPLFEARNMAGISSVCDHLLLASPAVTQARLHLGDHGVSDHVPLLVELATAGR
jgi:hypothetical protein